MISASRDHWNGEAGDLSGIERRDDEEVLKSVGVSAANGVSRSFRISFGMPSLALVHPKVFLEVSHPLSPGDKKKQPLCASRIAGSNSRSAAGFRT